MSHTDAILWHLKNKGPLTQATAAKLFGCWRLGARVYDLRRKGENIICENVPNASGRGTHGQYHYVGRS